MFFREEDHEERRKRTSSRARQYCCFRDILAKKKKKRKSKIQKLHVLYQKKYIVKKPSPLVNLPKKTTTYIKALEKEKSRNKINFLFFLPSSTNDTFEKRKTEERKRPEDTPNPVLFYQENLLPKQAK